MATIKVPYTYTSYSISEKATKYSKRLGQGKMSWAVAAFFIVSFAVFMLEGFILTEVGTPGDFLMVVILALPVALGVVAGIYAEKLRERYFRGKIRKALEADLAKIAQTQPDLADAYRRQLGDILK